MDYVDSKTMQNALVRLSYDAPQPPLYKGCSCFEMEYTSGYRRRPILGSRNLIQATTPTSLNLSTPVSIPVLSPKDEGVLAFGSLGSSISVVHSTWLGQCVMEAMGLACPHGVGLGSLAEFQYVVK